MKDGPLKSAFETETTGVLLQELTTYRIVDGMMRKEVTQRRFSMDGDYLDNTSVQPLGEVKDGTSRS
jgi:hypothetical protein